MPKDFCAVLSVFMHIFSGLLSDGVFCLHKYCFLKLEISFGKIESLPDSPIFWITTISLPHALSWSTAHLWWKKGKEHFLDYDLQWWPAGPTKWRKFHLDLVVKSELLGIVFRYHFFGITNQDFMMALANWTTARKDQAPDLLFLGNSFTFQDDSDEYIHFLWSRDWPK